LNIDVNDDISDAIITASIKPLPPGGIKFITSLGYAIFEHPPSLPQIALHSIGSLHPISSNILVKKLIIIDFN
jgi:hypothetical protein